MPIRLPDPPGHQALLHAIAELAAGPADRAPLWVVPPHFTFLVASGQQIGPDEAPPPGGHGLIIAIDLWSEADDPEASFARLQAALGANGRLILVQTNWPQRRGFVPSEAGGPPRSPEFYAWRSGLAAAWPAVHLGLAGLDHGLALYPLGAEGFARSDAIRPPEAIAFIASNLPLAQAQTALPLAIAAQPSALAEVSPAIAQGARRQLAFVIDVPDWAYANIVNHIAPHLAGRYEVTRFHIAEHPDRADLLSKLFVESSFDNIHFMWRELWFNAVSGPALLFKLGQKCGLTADQLAERLAAPVITTTIYDHLFLDPEEVEARRTALALTDGYSTASDLLAGIYSRSYGRAPDIVTADGVSTGFFVPQDALPPRPAGRFRIGWVGNSEWGKGKAGMGDDPKGLHSILRPAIAMLGSEGHEVELVLADRNLRQRNRDEMRDFYASEIDVLVCSSSFEGTPNPVLEAMASGRAWVSTDVGIVREVAGPVQQGLILSDRSPRIMADILRNLIADPELLTAAEIENKARAPLIGWQMRIADWTRLFAAAEARHAATHKVLRRRLVMAALHSNHAASSAPPPPNHDMIVQRLPTSLLAAHARIRALEDWLDNALRDNAERGKWIETLQTRVNTLEASWTARLAPAKILRAARRRLTRHQDR